MNIAESCLEDYDWELENDEIGVGLWDVVSSGRHALKLEGPALVEWVRRALIHLFSRGVTPSDGRYMTDDNPHGLAHFGSDTPDELAEGVIAAWVADGMPDLEWRDWRLNTPENRATMDALADPAT